VQRRADPPSSGVPALAGAGQDVAAAAAPRAEPRQGLLAVLRYLGPGFFVTIGFIDPGNWAANMAAGSRFGYSLLWIVTLSTALLMVVQHNAAHLGIVTGRCLAESAIRHLPAPLSRPLLASAVLAVVATALAELLGAAIGLQMLFGLPLRLGCCAVVLAVGAMLLSNGYARLERWIIGFVTAVGLAFLFEVSIAEVGWGEALRGWTVPSTPVGSVPLLAGVLGAVVMPHGIFLHSETIQSRAWHLAGEEVMRRRLRFEFMDTAAAMAVGWAINSAMILVASAVFHRRGMAVTELPQAAAALAPLLGRGASIVFALALVLAGVSSALTAAMAGGGIVAGFADKPYDAADRHSRWGIAITLVGAGLAAFFVRDVFQALLWSQIALSVQLPWTVLALAFLVSSRRVMGHLVAPRSHRLLLWVAVAVVTALNLMLVRDVLGGGGAT